MIIGRLTAKTKSPFWNTLYLTFLLKAFEIWAWYNSMCCWACSCFSSRTSSSWRRNWSLSSLVILVAKATHSDGIWIFKRYDCFAPVYQRKRRIVCRGSNRSSVSPKTFTELLIPISFVLWNKFLEVLDNYFIECFRKPISSRVISSWRHILNPIIVAKLIEYLACKLGTIIMNNPPGDTKPMNDMVFDKVDHVGSFNFNKWYNLCPLWEIISYC